MSRGQPRLRSQSTRRMLERCRYSGKTEEAIVIDDDTENADVVLIDSPNISHQGIEIASTARLNCTQQFVICIDDEENDSINVSLDSANIKFVETFSSLSLSEDSDNDDSLMFVGNEHASRDPGSSRNCYGLYFDLEGKMSHSTISDEAECDEFESSSSDCELIMDDLSGIIREQWEKAASMKKESYQYIFSNQPTTLNSTVYPENVREEACTNDAYAETYFEKMPFKDAFNISSNKTKESSSATDNTYCKATNNKSATQSYFKSNSACKEPDNEKMDDKPNLVECLQTTHLIDDGFTFLNKDAQAPAKSPLLYCESDGKTRFFDKEEPSARKSWHSSIWHESICPDRVEKKHAEVYYNAQSKQEMVMEGNLFAFEEKENIATADSKPPFYSKKEGDFLINSQRFKLCDDMDAQSNKVDALFEKSEGLNSVKPDDTSLAYETLIGGREKQKETEEYKLVAEEEWASRQRQLQIQAEEVQRLRKRRKAEKVRLLDTLKRQKQRLEEIRGLQKKDEEDMQLKEHIRTEVRQNLKKVEMNCRDMASVLRTLGIPVKGELIPTMHEINAAYKQALLRFHPDRASRTDIRQQVEAEEKFKLISRLKEVLMS